MGTRGAVLRLALVAFAAFPAVDGGRTRAEEPAKLAQVARDLGIAIVAADPVFPVATAHGIIDGKGATGDEVRAYTGLFVPEFSLYPTELFRQTRLRRVVLCRDLSFGGQRRNAIPDFEHDTLYLDVARGTHNQAYMRKVIHHEFFHIIDLRDDGSLYRDERWASLNPGAFRYGSGGKNAQNLPQTSVLTDKFPGFLNHYSTTGVEEDKAEVFANLVVDPEEIESRAKKDTVLRSKVRRMRELLADFCLGMNGGFWDKVRKARMAGNEPRPCLSPPARPWNSVHQSESEYPGEWLNLASHGNTGRILAPVLTRPELFRFRWPKGLSQLVR